MLDAKRPMQRVFWWGIGLGVCAASLIRVYDDSVISPAYFLGIFATICLLRITNAVCSVDDKLEDVIGILLEEEEDEIYHPPYEIELPEDED